MKLKTTLTTSLTGVLAATALFTSSVFAADLNSFGPHSVEASLVNGVVTHNSYSNVDSPLSALGASTEAQLANTGKTAPVTQKAIASHALQAPVQSTEALL